MALRRSGGIGIHCGQYDPFLDSASWRPPFYVCGKASRSERAVPRMVPAVRNGDRFRPGARSDSDAAESIRNQRRCDGDVFFGICRRHPAGERYPIFWRGLARRAAGHRIHGVPEDACARFLHRRAVAVRGVIRLDQVEGQAQSALLAGMVPPRRYTGNFMLRVRFAPWPAGYLRIGSARTIASLRAI